MARFKKKRSKPTPDRDEVQKREDEHHEQQDDGQEVDVPKGGDGPAPESGSAGKPTAGASDAPPTEDVPAGGDEPPISIAQQSEKDDKLNKLFWMRVAFAVVAGIAATFVFDSVEGEERRWASIGFMIVVFIITIIIGKTMRIPFSLSDRKKIVTQGIGSYIFMYLFMWIVSYTLVNMGDAESSLPFP